MPQRLTVILEFQESQRVEQWTVIQKSLLFHPEGRRWVNIKSTWVQNIGCISCSSSLGFMDLAIASAA